MMDDQKFSELSGDAKKRRKEWLKEYRDLLGEEHKRWGDSFFKALNYANTGGIVVVVSLMSIEAFRAAICLRLTLTFFVLGSAFTLIAIKHDFLGVEKRLRYWDSNCRAYEGGEKTFGEFFGPIVKFNNVSRWDRFLVVWPIALFFAGTVSALIFLWSS